MKFKSNEYILLNPFPTGDVLVAYCCCEQSTIPLETYYDINSIPSKEEIEGNMVWIQKSGFIGNSYNHIIFTKEKWYPSELLTKKAFIKKKRDSKLESLL